MKGRYLLVIIFSLVLLAFVAVYFFTPTEYIVKKSVSVQCLYMSYACGDCYSQYNVRGVEPAALEERLLKKDINIEFATKKQEKEFENQIGICGICYVYDFKGDLYFSNKKHCYVMKLAEYTARLNDKNCCAP